MRRAPVWLLVLAIGIGAATSACRRRGPRAVEPAASPRSLDPDPTAASVENTPAAPAAGAAGTERQAPPSDEELRAFLDPSFAALGHCLDGAGALDGGALTLRFSVAPSGMIVAAEIRGAPAAGRCATEVLRAHTLPPWRGDTLVVSVALTRAGGPMLIETDGGVR